MILVDSGVWIDFFRGTLSPHTDVLNGLLGRQAVAVADLILVEVLQGFDRDSEFADALRLLSLPVFVRTGGREVALQAAANYRLLRARGITVRKTIDALIATYCILHSTPLLFQDRDFDPFVEHLGLVSAMA
ncbi:MAG TPA: PIN domain nuclease [Allosphingosinicella sp.]|jgi:hypothetical protein